MTKKTRIAIITGARSDYGYLKPLMTLVKEHPRTELLPIVTGMHLSPAYGYTITNILQDGFQPKATIETLLNSDTTQSTAKSIALGILGHIEELPRLNPEFTVVLGDRFETFAAGIAVLHTSSILVHLHGGDLGTAIYDNYYRRGLTNLAQVHFVATMKSMERVLSQGVNPEMVFLSGSTTLDTILSYTPIEKSKLADILHLHPQKPWVLAIYHPSQDPTETLREFKTMMKAMSESPILENAEIIMIYPNADPGSQALIQTYQQTTLNIKFFKSLPYEQYLSLLAHATLMIGNSSSGIIEAPALHLPVINIGKRQENREQGKNVLNTDADLSQIKQALEQALTPEFKTRIKRETSPYGDGKASTRILNKLLELPTLKSQYSSTFHDNHELISKLRAIKDFSFTEYKEIAMNPYELINNYT